MEIKSPKQYLDMEPKVFLSLPDEELRAVAKTYRVNLVRRVQEYITGEYSSISATEMIQAIGDFKDSYSLKEEEVNVMIDTMDVYSENMGLYLCCDLSLSFETDRHEIIRRIKEALKAEIVKEERDRRNYESLKARFDAK